MRGSSPAASSGRAAPEMQSLGPFPGLLAGNLRGEMPWKLVSPSSRSGLRRSGIEADAQARLLRAPPGPIFFLSAAPKISGSFGTG